MPEQQRFLRKGKSIFSSQTVPIIITFQSLPKASSHQVCFHKSLFELVQEDEWPPEPSADSVSALDSSKVYKARLVWRKRGYEQIKLGTYYLQPSGGTCVFLMRQAAKKVGWLCFPLHWFAEFREVDTVQNETDEIVLETEALECETKEEAHEIFEQMCIFNFIDK
jgi:hypothetical protein